MAMVVFLKGVNVGGNKRFRPAALAKDLSAYDVVNLGAAGTFVVHGKVTQTKLRSEIAKRLPFEAAIIIVPGQDVLDLVADDPFPSKPAEAKRSVTVLSRKLRPAPALPIVFPASGQWQVRIFDVRGRFALSLWRRVGNKLVDPNQVFEKSFSVTASTRGWETVVKVADILEPRTT